MKTDKERKSKIITIRMTQDEHREILKHCKKNKLPVSYFIRAVVKHAVNG